MTFCFGFRKSLLFYASILLKSSELRSYCIFYILCPKGVANRNAAMKWIYEHVQEISDDSGAFYFADDDNTYDIRIFEEIRNTER